MAQRLEPGSKSRQSQSLAHSSGSSILTYSAISGLSSARKRIRVSSTKRASLSPGPIMQTSVRSEIHRPEHFRSCAFARSAVFGLPKMCPSQTRICSLPSTTAFGKRTRTADACVRATGSQAPVKKYATVLRGDAEMGIPAFSSGAAANLLPND